jgi:lysine-N-methylase
MSTMPLPIRTLPIAEQWDCHGCGRCCHQTIISLSADDRAKLLAQQWDENADYRGQRVMRRGLLGGGYTLAKRNDGACVFLLPDGRCRIHAEFGAEAKPLVCRMFPFQVVPLEKHANLGLRRSCPSAAANRGRPVREHLGEVRRLAEEGGLAGRPSLPPPIRRGQRGSWPRAMRVLDIFERMLCDARYPPVRRIVHGLQLCDLIEQCRLRKLDEQQFGELLELLENSVIAQSAAAFAERPPPRRSAAIVFRQMLLEYTRLHPLYVIRQNWGQRWRLVRMALGFARGKGSVPPIHECFPPATFAALEEPLGHLDAAVLQPLTAFFETAAASKHYAFLGHAGWPVIESLRALAVTYPVALWLLRLRCGRRRPEVDDAIDVVGAIDRGQGYAPLCGRRQRRRIASLSSLRELTRLVVWYAR